MNDNTIPKNTEKRVKKREPKFSWERVVALGAAGHYIANELAKELDKFTLAQGKGKKKAK